MKTTIEFHIDGLLIADSDISVELTERLLVAMESVLAGRYEVTDLHISAKPEQEDLNPWDKNKLKD